LDVQGDNGFGPNSNLEEAINLLNGGLEDIARNQTRDWWVQQGKNSCKIVAGFALILGLIAAAISIFQF
jgi:hypothetical protein